MLLPSYLSPACSSSSAGNEAAGTEDVACGRELEAGSRAGAGELSRLLAETNSMTSLNINTRLVIALGIVIDFS